MTILTLTRPRAKTYTSTIIFDMRQSGATLQQIADRVGKTKERVRQILVQNHGSAKHRLISTERLRKLFGMSRDQLFKLYRDSIITPARDWGTGNGHHLLWSADAPGQIATYISSQRLCRVCHGIIPWGRRVFCSRRCYKEGHKYKYKNAEAKQRHMASVKAYRERKKRRASGLVVDDLRREREKVLA